MDRRAFLAVAIGALAAPLAAETQPAGKVYRIGYMAAGSSSDPLRLAEALRLGLRDLGYVEGKNLSIEYRWAETKHDRLPDLAAELVRLKVDLIVTYGTAGTLAAKRATSTIPIVMATSADAVATGLVESLARPGGNVTGSVNLLPELNAKRVELLTQALPTARRIAALANPGNLAHPVVLKAMEAMARARNVDLLVVEARDHQDFPGVFSTMAERRVEAISVLDDPMLITHAQQIAELAAKNQLPSIGFTEMANAGGLIGYGVNFAASFRRAATFVDKIFKGANPGELPIEQATHFQFAINLKTATALGLTIPPSLLLRADQVIE